MASYETRFITPPREEEEIYPYRRVWPSVALEAGLLFALGVGLFVLLRFIVIPSSLYRLVGLAIALAPVGLWLAFSWLRERTVPQPRINLMAVVVVTALAANAVGIPLVEDYLQVDSWLPLESAIGRIIGYTFTEGIVEATIMYLVLRYTVWPRGFRTRLDAVAYGAACALGYATVLNVRLILSNALPPDVAAFRVFDNLAVQTAMGIVIGYGLAEVCFNDRPFPLLLGATVMLAAFITGAAIPLRSGLTNAGLVQGVSTVRPILGFLFSAGVLFAASIAFRFLFDNAEREDRDAAAQRED